MNYKKSLAALGVVAAMGMSMASAAPVAVVNVGEVMTKMPAYASYMRAMEGIQAQYGAQVATAQQEFAAAKDAKAQEAVQQKYLPLMQKVQEAEVAAGAEIGKQVTEALDRFWNANQSKYDAMIPMQLPAGAQVVDVTAQVK